MEILEFDTILESHRKVMDFCLFKKSWKTDISREKSLKSHGILQKPSVLCTICGYSSLKFAFKSPLLSFTLSRACIIMSV